MIHTAYEAYERFETFSRAPSVTVSDYIIEFERLYNKAKQHKMELPDGVLAYRFEQIEQCQYFQSSQAISQSHSSRTELPEYEGSAQKRFLVILQI